jgi:hypothetical protein
MGKYNGAVITTAGQNLIAQAIAESKTVTFTTAQASSHVYPSSTNFEALTALTDVEKTVDINYAGVYSDTVVQVSARFDNDGVDTAYLINTLGFFAQLGTDTPILFAVSTAVTPDQMPVFDADNPSAFIYNMQITVQNADSINLSVNPAGTVTVDQLNTAISALQTQINGKVNLSEIIDNLNEASAVSGDVLSAHQGNVLAELMAPVQINLTAKQPYAVGDQFIYNGLLYKFTTATSQNEAIVIGGNCKLADCVTAQLSRLINIEIIPTSNSEVIIYRVGRICHLKCALEVATYNQGWNVLTNVPSRACPNVVINAIGVDNSSTSTNAVPIEFRLATNGNFSVYAFHDKLSFSALINITYIARDK